MPANRGIELAIDRETAADIETLVTGMLQPLLRRGLAPLPAHPNGRRFLFIHLDGVSRDTLVKAATRGYTPFISRLLDGGAFELSPCYAGAPTSTPAFQAGVLYGARDADIPGFAWYDRGRRREMKMDRAVDAAVVEKALRRGRRGLLENGAANFLLFSGGARTNGWSMSGWAESPIRLMHSTEAWDVAASTVAYSCSVARIAGRLFAETGEAVRDLIHFSGAVGRLQHEPTFLWHRLNLTIGAHEQATFATIMDMARGIPAIYTVLANYDEIAHRRGPGSEVALESIRGMDDAIAHMFATAAALPEQKYDLYIASDHGQVATVPFEQITGLTLKDYLALAEPREDGPPRVPEEAARRMRRFEAWARVADNLPMGLRCACQPLIREAACEALPHHSARLRLLGQVECVEAGDLAHVYLGDRQQPLPLAGIEARYPRILKLVRDCPAIGLVAVRGGDRGFVFYRGRRLDLAEPGQLRTLDLGYPGRRVGEFVTRMLANHSAGDLVCYGNGLPDGSNVAFSWEFGSHAGVGREEVENFVIHPRGTDFDFSAVSQGADLYDFFSGEYQLDPGGWSTRP